MKQVISKNEKMQLLGLLTLAIKHRKIIDEIEKNIQDILETEDKYTLISDAIYEDSPDLNETLKAMKIKVGK